MKEEEKVKLKINIAGESFVANVPYHHQEETRQTETDVNVLFDTWRTRFPEKGDRELLAMIAFRYADRYGDLMRERLEASEELARLTSRLEELI